MRTFRAVWLGVMLCSAGSASTAAAQGFARAQDIETSIRAAAMGGASAAVGWGEPAPWGNPAALSETRGLAWLAGSTKSNPSGSSEVTFETQRFLLGGEGLGFTLMGQPVSGLGRTRLEYGVFQGTDAFGNPLPDFPAYEQVEGWGVGVSPVQLVDLFRLQRDPDARRYSQRADISFGYQGKSTEISIAPGDVQHADNHDWGVQARFAILPGDHEGREPRVEFGAGYADLNVDQNTRWSLGPGPSPPVPSTRIERTGISLHASLPFAGSEAETTDPWGWWFATVPRALDLGVAYDMESLSYPGASGTADVKRVGFEASLMGILAGRMGYVNDPTHVVDAMSFGFGVHVPLGPWASFGYDWASVPQTKGADALVRQGFAAWLHPIVLWRSTRE